MTDDAMRLAREALALDEKATPGPWSARDREWQGGTVKAIADVAWCGAASSYGRDAPQSISVSEAQANARLIAAARHVLGEEARTATAVEAARGRVLAEVKGTVGAVTSLGTVTVLADGFPATARPAFGFTRREWKDATKGQRVRVVVLADDERKGE